MREEINEILPLLQIADEGISALRDELLSLTVEEPQGIRDEITRINRLIPVESINDHDNMGIRYFLIGCCYFELNEFEQAAQSLNRVMLRVWDSDIHRSLAHWIAGMIHTARRNFDRASKEVITAYKLVEAKISSSVRIKNENILRQGVRLIFENRIANMSNPNLMNNIEAGLEQENNYRTQEKQEGEDKTPTVNVVNENYPVNKLSFFVSGVRSEGEAAVENVEENKENVSRTDDPGFIYIQSIPVYKQEAQAGASGKMELQRELSSYTETEQVVLNGFLHNIYSLRLGQKGINITANGQWGWLKVTGKSMNKLKLEDNNFVLFQYNESARDKDIVIACFPDQDTTIPMVVIKQYKEVNNTLISQTFETVSDPDYLPIDIEKAGVQIIGVVYAVAKPVAYPP